MIAGKLRLIQHKAVRGVNALFTISLEGRQRYGWIYRLSQTSWHSRKGSFSVSFDRVRAHLGAGRRADLLSRNSRAAVRRDQCQQPTFHSGSLRARNCRRHACLVVRGVSGLKGFLSRLLLWRCSLGWYAFLILAIPAIYVVGSLVKGNLLSDQIAFSTFSAALGAIAFMLVLGPIEEFGWRGIALPLLQRRMAPVWAGLLLGVIRMRMASARVFSERNAPKRLGYDSVLSGLGCGQYYSDADVQ